MRRDERAQLHVIEAIIVGVVVFVALAITAVFRIPTAANTFQQAELAGLGEDALHALYAKPPQENADCNEAPPACDFSSELERMISLALAYEGASATDLEERDIDPLSDYFEQALPPGARYILSYSNGVNATKIHPLNLVPPVLDVEVGHVFLSPNWAQHSDDLEDSVLIRLTEITGFQDASTSSIRDPMNRAEEEWGRTHKSLLSDATGTKRVPVSALYGTYSLCPPLGACSPFSVVPPGIFGAGASILSGDRDNATSIQSWGPFFTYAKFFDETPDNQLAAEENLYLDFNAAGSNLVGARDLRLSRVEDCKAVGIDCPPGSFVVAGDADVGDALEVLAGSPGIRHQNGDADGTLDETEYLYLDLDADANVDVTERRISRVATFEMGSPVESGDLDEGAGLAPVAFSPVTVRWADTNGNGVPESGEAVYLDLEGNGQDAGLESLDIHLNPKGTATVRYLYDIQMVIWYGI